MPYELCHARRQLLSAPVRPRSLPQNRISSCVSVSLSVSVSYVQFICSYNFDDGDTQYRSLLYTVLSTLYPHPLNPSSAFCAACQLSHTPDGITLLTLSRCVCAQILRHLQLKRCDQAIRILSPIYLAHLTCRRTAINPTTTTATLLLLFM